VRCGDGCRLQTSTTTPSDPPPDRPTVPSTLHPPRPHCTRPQHPSTAPEPSNGRPLRLEFAVASYIWYMLFCKKLLYSVPKVLLICTCTICTVPLTYFYQPDYVLPTSLYPPVLHIRHIYTSTSPPLSTRARVITALRPTHSPLVECKAYN